MQQSDDVNKSNVQPDLGTTASVAPPPNETDVTQHVAQFEDIDSETTCSESDYRLVIDFDKEIHRSEDTSSSRETNDQTVAVDKEAMLGKDVTKVPKRIHEKRESY